MKNTHTVPPQQPSAVAPQSVTPTKTSVLARIMCAVTQCEDKPEPISEFDYTFEKPRYSSARLQKMHLITLKRDIKIAKLERDANLRALCEQQERAAKCAIRPLSRWYEGIKDPAIAAVYKSTLQLIRRLTRGKR